MSCHSIEVSFKNILRRIWHLPCNCHTRILHLIRCTARLPSLFNVIISRAASLLSSALSCSSLIARKVFGESSLLAYTHMGCKAMSGGLHAKQYYEEDGLCATVIRHLRVFGPLKDNDLNGMIDTICTNQCMNVIFVNLHLQWCVLYNNNDNNIDMSLQYIQMVVRQLATYLLVLRQKCKHFKLIQDFVVVLICLVGFKQMYNTYWYCDNCGRLVPIECQIWHYSVASNESASIMLQLILDCLCSYSYCSFKLVTTKSITVNLQSSVQQLSSLVRLAWISGSYQNLCQMLLLLLKQGTCKCYCRP